MSPADSFVPDASGTPDDAATITFGFRGEDIEYRRQGRGLEISFTWINGPRVFAATIDKWNDGAELSDDEKRSAFRDVLQFVARERRRSIVVINADDPSRALWEHLCAKHASLVAATEHTSDEVELARERESFLSILRAGKELSIGGVDIRDEHHLDEVLKQCRHRRS